MSGTIWIVGTGSQARYAIDTLQKQRGTRIGGLVEILERRRVGQMINGVRVTDFFTDFLKAKPSKKGRVLVGLGDTRRKKDLVSQLERKGFGFTSVISTAA